MKNLMYIVFSLMIFTSFTTAFAEAPKGGVQTEEQEPNEPV